MTWLGVRMIVFGSKYPRKLLRCVVCLWPCKYIVFPPPSVSDPTVQCTGASSENVLGRLARVFQVLRQTTCGKCCVPLGRVALVRFQGLRTDGVF